MNIWIRWHVGYYAYVAMNKLHLNGGRIFFYNKNGDVVCFNLEDTAMFDMRVNCDFNFRKKLNFTRNEVFAIRFKGGEYALYIPMNEVNLRFIRNKEITTNNGFYVYKYKLYSIKGTELHFWNEKCDLGKVRQGDNGTIIFEEFGGCAETEEHKKIDKLKVDIIQNCDVSISDYDLSKILQKYRIIKKKK